MLSGILWDTWYLTKGLFFAPLLISTEEDDLFELLQSLTFGKGNLFIGIIATVKCVQITAFKLTSVSTDIRARDLPQWPTDELSSSIYFLHVLCHSKQCSARILGKTLCKMLTVMYSSTSNFEILQVYLVKLWLLGPLGASICLADNPYMICAVFFGYVCMMFIQAQTFSSAEHRKREGGPDIQPYCDKFRGELSWVWSGMASTQQHVGLHLLWILKEQTIDPHLLIITLIARGLFNGQLTQFGKQQVTEEQVWNRMTRTV